MKNKYKVLAVLAISIMAAPVQAAFGGLRLGVNVGVQLLQGRHFYAGPNSPSLDMIKRISKVGSLLGAHGGYLFELDNKFVVGFEAYYLMPGTNTSFNLILINGPVEGSVSIKHTRSIGLAGTVGMMLNPKVLAYLNLGYESASFRFNYNINVAGATSPTLNHKFNGLMVGLGGTYKMAPHFLLGVELSTPFFKKFQGSTTLPRLYRYKPVERRFMVKLSYLL